MGMDDWVLCSTCFQLVKSAKQHHDTESHRSFTYPVDGELNVTCLVCNSMFNYFNEVEVHIEQNKDHVNFKKANGEHDVDVFFSIKKSKIPDLEKSGLFNDVKEDLFSPMKTSRSLFKDVKQDLFSAMKSLEEMVEMLVPRRKLEYFGLGEELMEEIRKTYVLVEDQTRDRSLEIINDHLKKSTPEEDLFEFELTNVIGEEKNKKYEFHPLLKQIALIKKTHPCSTTRGTSAVKARRLWKLLTGIRHLVFSRKSSSLREMYYRHPELYSSCDHTQDLTNDDITDISTMMGLTIQSLNIFASPTGTIRGPLLLFIGDKILADCSMGGIAGCRIPAEVHNVTEIRAREQINYILVVEKEGIFEALTADWFPERNHCVLFSGKGQPSASSRLLLRRLSDSLGVPIYGLFDGNYGGALICCTYKFGSENRAYDSLLLTVPNLVWIGVFPHEVEKKYKRKMGDEQHKKLRTLMMKSHMEQFPDFLDNLEKMHMDKHVCDIEMISMEGNLSEYIESKVRLLQSL